MNKYRKKFLLDPSITHLNHGSFGATPISIMDEYSHWQRKLEMNPVDFIDNQLPNLVQESRHKLSGFLNCDKDDIVYCPNPTTALNTVIRSLNLKANDEILTTDHEYGALSRTWNFICKKTGAKLIEYEVPFPMTNEEDFIDSFLSKVNQRTKVIFISHITSPSSIVFPVQKICDYCNEKNIISIIDGAHVPGHIPLDISSLSPDFYSGACHKWMCSPKGVSFLYSKKSKQDLIEPLIVSWGYEAEKPSHSQFLDYLQWQGTNDISAYLTIPSVIDNISDEKWKNKVAVCKENIQKVRKIILEKFDFTEFSKLNYNLQMHSIVHNLQIENIKDKFYNNYKIQIPINVHNNYSYFRFSFHVYNEISEMEKFIDCFEDFMKKSF